MDTWLDLHMHSHYSMDGEFEPGRLMELCAEAGLKAVALADHKSSVRPGMSLCVKLKRRDFSSKRHR